jgi:hypothetical protein
MRQRNRDASPRNRKHEYLLAPRPTWADVAFGDALRAAFPKTAGGPSPRMARVHELTKQSMNIKDCRPCRGRGTVALPCCAAICAATHALTGDTRRCQTTLFDCGFGTSELGRKIIEICEGTSEIQRLVISRHVLR